MKTLTKEDIANAKKAIDELGNNYIYVFSSKIKEKDHPMHSYVQPLVDDGVAMYNPYIEESVGYKMKRVELEPVLKPVLEFKVEAREED